jgi:hypothetical protein
MSNIHKSERVDKALTNAESQVDKEQAEPVVEQVNTNQGETK